MKRAENRAWTIGDDTFIDVSTAKLPRAIAIIDTSDVALVFDGRGSWHAFRNDRKNGRVIYAKRHVLRATQYMHSAILSAPGHFTDHVDYDGLDNRRHNLRLVTPRQSAWNRRPIGGASRFKGVYLDRSGKWAAAIKDGPKVRYLGIFPDEESAARAYDEVARERFSPYAYLNFGSAS